MKLPDKRSDKKTSTRKKSSISKSSDNKKKTAKKSSTTKKTAKTGKGIKRGISDKKKTVKKRITKKTISTTIKKKADKPKIDEPKKDLKKSEKSELELIQESDKDIDPAALKRGDTPMSLVGHLDEFRSRLLVSLLTIIIIALGSFFFSEHILNIIERPYTSTGLKLNVFNITEGFLLRLKAALISGILIGLPIVIYEIWRYISPAINKGDRRFARLSIIAAVLLFWGGLVFTYLFILPFAIKMLLSFTPEGMQNMQNASNYLSFVLLFSLGMGLLFELPIVIMILTRIGLVTPDLLIRKRKYAIVLIFIIAAIITPPDVLTQIMIGIPLIILYEISIFISKFMVIRKKKRELRDKV